MDKALKNKFYLEMEEILKNKSKNKKYTGDRIYQNYKKVLFQKKVYNYIKFSTTEEYENFCICIYENRHLIKNGGMAYV